MTALAVLSAFGRLHRGYAEPSLLVPDLALGQLLGAMLLIGAILKMTVSP